MEFTDTFPTTITTASIRIGRQHHDVCNHLLTVDVHHLLLP